MNPKILIVGGSSGLGRQLAISYARSGSVVGVLARREHLLDELAREYPGRIFTRKADIAGDACIPALRELITAMSGMDIIIITAAVIHFNQELAAQPENETVSVNVQGFTHIITFAWEYFKSKGSGQIVGITSIAAARGNKLAPAYHASKSYQSVYLEGLRVKAAKEKNKIAITELVPGYIRTAMGRGERMFWVSSVEKAARLARRSISKKRKRAFLPKRWWWVYHFQRLLPTFIYDWVVNGNWKTKQRP